MYQALYRKWRPQTFADVIGQQHVTDTLRAQLQSGRLSHAYLFTGSRGTGKTSCAKILAKAVNCERPENGNPCNECAACRAIDAGACLDVLEIDAASNNGVDQVRALRDDAIYSPAEVRMRVYIVDEVHMLSTAAFNALLKIIEEPPAQVVFLLTCNNRARVLPTILSRAAVLPLSVCSVQECETALHTLEPQMTAERIAQAARLAHGNIGKARMILQDEGSLKLACDAQRIAQMVCVGQEFELLCSLQEYTNNKQRTNFLLLMQEVRRCMVDWIRQQHGLVSQGEPLPPTVKNRFSTLQAMQILDIIDTAVAQASQNVSLSLVAAAFCAAVKMKRQ